MKTVEQNVFSKSNEVFNYTMFHSQGMPVNNKNIGFFQQVAGVQQSAHAIEIKFIVGVIKAGQFKAIGLLE